MDIETLIIVITYNSRDFISSCIDSIISSDYRKWFLAVVDNNSSDMTARVVEDIEKNSWHLDTDNFRFIKNTRNTGFAGAVNQCVFNFLIKEKNRLAGKIKYLLMVNPDTILEKNTIFSLVDVFESDKKNRIGAAGGIILDYNKDSIQNAGGRIVSNFISSHLTETRAGLYPVDYVSGALFMTELSVFKGIGGFDTGYRPVYFEELDYCLKLKRIGRESVITKKASARHFECASIGKFSPEFLKYYHKNRIRCMVLNVKVKDFFKTFLPEELRWLKMFFWEQSSAVLSAYFLNFLFLIYNLIIRLKNILLIKNYKKRGFI